MLRKRNLKRYNPFKEFETKYEEGENILTKIRRILDENDNIAESREFAPIFALHIDESKEKM